MKNYLDRISKPFLDRIDICTETVQLDFKEVYGVKYELEYKNRETSEQIRKRVLQAQKIQKERYKKETFKFNSYLSPSNIKKYCIMTSEAKEFLKDILEKMSFSARAYHKILKTSRTIADIEQKSLIEKEHIAEAVCYRSVNSKYWREGRNSYGT